jgi:outer membrane murein-binding lipoprotein Lpp
VLAAVKALVPTPAQEGTAAEAPDAVAKLEAQVAELKTQVEAAAAKEQAAQQEAAKAATAQAVAEKVEALLKDFAHRELVEEHLRKCESVEAVEAAFTERKAIIEQAIARASVQEAGKPAGSGEADKKDEAKGKQDEPARELTPEQKQQLEHINRDRRIMGLKPLKALPQQPAKA